MTIPSDGDFEKFLAEATTAEELKNESQEYALNLDRRFDDAVSEAGVPRLTHDDPEVQESLRADAIEQVQVAMRETLDRPDDMAQETYDGFLRMQAEEFITKLTMKEIALTTRAKMLITSYEYDYLHSSHFDLTQHTESKHKFFARLIVGEEYTPDDEWLLFLNKMIPGGHVDMNGSEFQNYIIDAIEEYANEQEDKEKRQLFLAKLIVLLGGDDDDTERALQVIRLAGQSMGIALYEHRQHEREAQIREACAKINVDDKLVEQLLAILAEEYPVT